MKRIPFFRKKVTRSNIDTSIDGYKYIGINLTQQQFEDICTINIMMAGDTGKFIPIHCVLLTLKCLGLLPPELVCEVSNNESTDNPEDISQQEFQKRYGRLKN